MSSSSVSPQMRKTAVKFRVLTRCYMQHWKEFVLELKDITWHNLLRKLFGNNEYDDQHVPTIILLGEKHRMILRHSNIKQLIRDALEGPTINLLIPDYNLYFTDAWDGNEFIPDFTQNERQKAEITDFTKIFSNKLNVPAMNHLMGYSPHIYDFSFSNESADLHLSANNNSTQLGELCVTRLKDNDMINLLKDGTGLILPVDDGEMILVKFSNDQLPTFKKSQIIWKDVNSSYKCDTLKVPVIIDDKLKFVFNEDAQLIKKTVANLLLKDEFLLNTPEVEQPSGESARPDVAIPLSTSIPATLTAAAPNEAPVPVASETLCNEGTQTPRLQGRPYRQRPCKRMKRSVHSATSVPEPPSFGGIASQIPLFYPHKMVGDFSALSISPDTPSTAAKTEVVETPANEQDVEGASKVQPGIANAPEWFDELLRQFKSEILQDVKEMVKSTIGTAAIPSTSNDQSSNQTTPKTLRARAPRDDSDHLQKENETQCTASSSKHKHGSSKRKSTLSSSKREHKSSSPSEKTIVLANGIFVTSKSGFKVRMPRNESINVNILLGLTPKFRSFGELPELRIQPVSSAIECCVKRSVAAKYTDVPNSMMEKNVVENYDIRIKSKDKSGKFKIHFIAFNGSKVCGQPFKIDVRVKKDCTLPAIGAEALSYGHASTSAATAVVEKSTQVGVTEWHSTKARSELVDEGIGANQEDFLSPTSDSECSEGSDFKQDEASKEEDADALYQTRVKELVTSALAKIGYKEPKLDSDSDTDSSISFLMDENEARNESDLVETVQMPSCFMSYVESNDDVLPVRVKRKSSSAKRKTAGSDTDAVNETVSEIPKPEETLVTIEDAPRTCSYPNIQGFKECLRPDSCPPRPEPTKPNDNSANPQTSPEASTSSAKPTQDGYPINILPEKVFETVGNVWSNIYTPKTQSGQRETLPQHVHHAASSVFASVSNELQNAAYAAGVAAAKATAAAASIVPNIPMPPPSPTAPSDSSESSSKNSQKANCEKEFKPAKPSTSDGATSSQTSAKPETSTQHEDNASYVHKMYANLSEKLRDDLIKLHDMGFTDDPYMIYLLGEFPNDLSKVIESLVNYSKC